MKNTTSHAIPSPRKHRWLYSTALVWALAACDKTVYIETVGTAKGYLLHPRTTKDTQPRDILALENVSRVQDVLHALKNQDHKGKHAQRAHTLKELGETSLASPSTKEISRETEERLLGSVTTITQETSPVYYDLLGESGQPDKPNKNETVYLNQKADFTAMIVDHVDLELRSSTNLTVGAMEFRSGTLTIQDGATMTVNGLHIGKDAALIGGKNLTLNSETAPGIVDILTLNKRRSKKDFNWLTEKASLCLEGTLDQTPKFIKDTWGYPTTTLTPLGENATIRNYTDPMLLNLSCSNQLTIDNLNVSAEFNGIWSINWNTSSQKPLVTVTTLTKIPFTFVNITSLNPSIQVNDTLTVVTVQKNTTSTPQTNLPFELSFNNFGGKFKLIATPNDVKITLTEKGVTSETRAALSLGAQHLSDGILTRKGDSASRLMPLDIPTALATLNTLADSSTWFHHTGLPNYAAIHDRQLPGAWVLTPNVQTSAVGMTALNGLQLAVSRNFTHKTNSTVAAHASYGSVAVDLIHRPTQFGTQCGWMGRYLNAGISYDYSMASGTRLTALGPVTLNPVGLHRTTAYVGVQTSIDQLGAPAIQLGARLSLDIHRLFPTHSYSILRENFHVASQTLDRGIGLELNLKIPVKSGVLSFDYHGYAVHKQLKQSVAFTVEIND